MRKAFKASLVAGIMVASGCTHGSAIAHSRLTDLHAVDIRPGANQIDKFMADGRSGLVVEGWRDLGDDKGYRLYSTMIPNANPVRGWDVVMIQPPAGDPSAGELTEIAGSVRFARGWLDGAPGTFMITAKRDGAETGQAGRFGFDVYRLAAGHGTEAENVFEPVMHTASQRDYCNADLALAREFELKLSPGYTGLRNSNGCNPGNG